MHALMTALACFVVAGPKDSPAESVVRALYPMVSFGPNTEPEWNKVRALFANEAIVVLRTSRAAVSTFTLEGFIDDFVKFAARPQVRTSGFRERVVRLKATQYGDIAQVLVLYEAEVLGVTKPAQQGVDSFHLVRRDGQWRIISIVNDVVTPDKPLPPELRDGPQGGGA
jgi:hypothetical protein